MMKRILCLIMVAMGFTFAQDVYVRNVCDTLVLSSSPKIELELAYIDEVLWYGDKNLSKADSVKNSRHQDYFTLEPIFVKYVYKIPYTITAGCVESTNNLYAYAEWNQSQKNGPSRNKTIISPRF